MPASIEPSELARILPGAWHITATNFPMWLAGTRFKPVLTYELLSSDPLALTDVVHYETSDGEPKTIAADKATKVLGWQPRPAGEMDRRSTARCIQHASTEHAGLSDDGF